MYNYVIMPFNIRFRIFAPLGPRVFLKKEEPDSDQKSEIIGLDVWNPSMSIMRVPLFHHEVLTRLVRC